MRKLIVTIIAAMTLSAAARADEADANADRLGFSPTANTLHQGQFVFNDYELFFLQGSVGVTDHVQLSFMTLAPVFQGLPFFGLASLKGRYFEQGGLKLAAIGSASLLTANGSGGGTLSVGHALTYCPDSDCRGELNLELDANWAWGAGTSAVSSNFLLHGGAGLAFGLSEHVKLLAELNFGGVHSSAEGMQMIHGVAFAYGLRFHSGDIAGDVGFAKLIDGSGAADVFLLGIPVVNFSYRFGGKS